MRQKERTSASEDPPLPLSVLDKLSPLTADVFYGQPLIVLSHLR